MKKLVYGLLMALAVSCTADLEDQLVKESASSQNNDKIIHSSKNALPGKIIVCFGPEAESRLAKSVTRSGATRSGIAGVDAVLDKVDGYSVKQLFMITEKNRDKVYAAGLHRWYVLYFDKESDLDSVAAELAAVAEVKTVEYSLKVQRILPKKTSSANISSAATMATRAKVSKIPFNDPYRFYQWGLDNQGTNSQIVGDWTRMFEPITEADINVVPAWKLCTGDPSIVVAIIDEGVQYNHEDLKDNYYYNTAELEGSPGVDDDGNGYVDDIYGWNFVKDSASLTWDAPNPIDSQYADDGHGVHVAGTISAVNNNGIGISSIAGGSGKKDGVKIFSAQMFSANGDKGNGGDTESSVKAIQYAAERKAHIIQCSWGYPSGIITSDSKYLLDEDGSAEATAIEYFIREGGTKDGPISGGLAIFAAGNDTSDIPMYPSAYEPCVSVASIGPSLKPAYYTNYGYGVDISAPGGDMVLYPGSSNSLNRGGILSSVPRRFSDSNSPNYAMFQGTSMACPMVSGVAALGLSYAKQLGKRYTAQEFRSMLLSATNDISPYLTGWVTLNYTDGTMLKLDFPTYKGRLGTGYIDAYKLLLQIEGTPYTTIIAGDEAEINLSCYFGSGIKNMVYKDLSISSEDIAAVGFSNASYSDGKLKITCSKSGCARVTVSMYVGGISGLEDTPSATEISKTFVVMSRAKVASNGGWL